MSYIELYTPLHPSQSHLILPKSAPMLIHFVSI